jgi:hypothetical protein
VVRPPARAASACPARPRDCAARRRARPPVEGGARVQSRCAFSRMNCCAAGNLLPACCDHPPIQHLPLRASARGFGRSAAHRPRAVHPLLARAGPRAVYDDDAERTVGRRREHLQRTRGSLRVWARPQVGTRRVNTLVARLVASPGSMSTPPPRRCPSASTAPRSTPRACGARGARAQHARVHGSEDKRLSVAAGAVAAPQRPVLAEDHCARPPSLFHDDEHIAGRRRAAAAAAALALQIACDQRRRVDPTHAASTV